jgi:precorrin-6Y C5,15-methyltransferase (decarboxylating)
VELALSAPEGQVFAVECDEDACALVRENKRKFSTWNLQLVEGKAPQALAGLPAPDAVFIGGTKGGMEDIVGQVLAKNENARICISAIALETLSAAVTALEKHGLEADVAQIAVSRTRPAGKLHLLMANNPTFLITGERHG